MYKRVSSGERHTSSGDNIAPIIDRSMANASSTACRPFSKKNCEVIPQDIIWIGGLV